MKKFWYTKEVKTSFSETLDNIEFALSEEGFWILHRVDMQWAMKKKLDKDIDDYIILWACNPRLASDLLDEEYEIWLLLPCNIIVYRSEWNMFVSALMPTTAMNMIYNNIVKSVAKKAEKKLKKVIDSL